MRSHLYRHGHVYGGGLVMSDCTYNLPMSTLCYSLSDVRTLISYFCSCFAITLLHHAPPRVVSVLVLFVILGGLFN